MRKHTLRTSVCKNFPEPSAKIQWQLSLPEGTNVASVVHNDISDSQQLMRRVELPVMSGFVVLELLLYASPAQLVQQHHQMHHQQQQQQQRGSNTVPAFAFNHVSTERSGDAGLQQSRASTDPAPSVFGFASPSSNDQAAAQIGLTLVVSVRFVSRDFGEADPAQAIYLMAHKSTTPSVRSLSCENNRPVQLQLRVGQSVRVPVRAPNVFGQQLDGNNESNKDSIYLLVFESAPHINTSVQHSSGADLSVPPSFAGARKLYESADIDGDVLVLTTDAPNEGEAYIHAHSLILRMCLPTWRDAHTFTSVGTSNKLLDLSESLDDAQAKALLYFCYTGTLGNDGFDARGSLTAMFDVAQKMAFTELQQMCDYKLAETANQMALQLDDVGSNTAHLVDLLLFTRNRHAPQLEKAATHAIASGVFTLKQQQPSKFQELCGATDMMQKVWEASIAT